MIPSRFRTLIVFCMATIVSNGAMAQSHGSFESARNKMVDSEIVAAGVKNPRVVEAMRKTPRHEFVPIAHRKNA
ncbi:MAG: hypothetical protein ABFC54_08395, partial [Thermoguttaceae bacterium]